MSTRPDRYEDDYLEEGTAFADLAGLDPGRTGRFDVIVIGGGQAGLSVGHHLARRRLRFVILDASERIGDSWRERWDSLRLFTPAGYDGLPGMPFPAHRHYFPTKDEMGDYLESYAARFALPVRSGTRVEHLGRRRGRYVVRANGEELEADHVVVAMSNYQVPRVPAFASELRDDVVQLHSRDYANPSQLKEGAVLIVGAGNSGAEIAAELSSRRRVILSGRHPGQLPFEVAGFFGRHLLVRLVLRVLFHRILTIRTWLGRRAYPKVTKGSGPLIRTKRQHLAARGVERVARTAGVRDGLPELEDGRVLDVENVVWCTGYHPGFSWIDLPVFDDEGKPRHDGGVVENEPGLYFVGLHFLYALSSAMVQGVGRDADRIAGVIAERVAAARPREEVGRLAHPTPATAS